ncbi:MFS transporter [Nocardioides sp. BYT-33-1]|uniref:MFS transporter n=1 Tax=Nocardioides sp. BYT-33-1 TaxID=3416952 RepID=UPI003F53B85F
MTDERLDLDSGQTAPAATGWAALLHRDLLPAVLVLSGGVALYAMNLYFTAALMPSVVASIGGAEYFAWAATGYLVVAVVATMLVGRTLERFGARRSYLAGFVLFGLGTVASAASPSMVVFVAGRGLQGAGAGLLIGLGYAVIRTTLPAHTWTQASSLVSAMFALGALVGPALGGIFAELELWRASYVVLAVVSALLALIATRALPAHTASPRRGDPLPLRSFVALTLAAALLSISSTTEGGRAVVLVVAGLATLVAFLLIDARATHSVLPRITYLAGGRLKWVYLTVAALSAGVMVENFVPLFGQQLAGMTPVWAGFLGAVMSIGWSAAQVFSAGAGPAAARRLVLLSPWLVAAGLAGYGLLQTAGAGAGSIALWAGFLLLAGIGVGIAFPHLTVAAMSSTPDPGEGARAAAAVSTTQLIAYTLTSAVAGNLLALGSEAVDAARWVILGLAVLVAVGVVGSRRALPR